MSQQQQQYQEGSFLSAFTSNLKNNSTFYQQDEKSHQEQQQQLTRASSLSNIDWLSSSGCSFNPSQQFSFPSPNHHTNNNNNRSSSHLFKPSFPQQPTYSHYREQEQQQQPCESSKKRKRCDEDDDETTSTPSMFSPSIDLMKEAMILPNIGDEDSSMFFESSSVGGDLMQFSMQHQQSLFPMFESEEDMITSAANYSSSMITKKNRMSPQSHLIEFIRDNIMQYLLFHLKLDMRQTMPLGDDETNVDDVKMNDTNPNETSGVEQDVDITIPVGLLLDYIVQQAQRLYFDMYEYIRELASSSIKHQCKSNDQKEIELSLACNEFEKMVIEQVHFLLSQIQLMRSSDHQQSASHHTPIIPMLNKYDKILPKNFHTLRLVCSTSDGIGSDADSFTLAGIVDESFLFKSTSPYHRSSFTHNFDDMKTNSTLNNDISSLLLNTKFNFKCLH